MTKVDNVFKAYAEASEKYWGLTVEQMDEFEEVYWAELKRVRKAYKQLMKRAAKTADGSELKVAIGKKFKFEFPYVEVNLWEPLYCDFVMHAVNGGPDGLDTLHIDEWHDKITSMCGGHKFNMSPVEAIDFLVINGFTPISTDIEYKTWVLLYNARVAALGVANEEK